jgi:hypothetical protein
LDWVYDSSTSQEYLYQSIVAELVEDAPSGAILHIIYLRSKKFWKNIHSAGSHQFHTQHSFFLLCNEDAGMIPRAAQHIFQRISSTGANFNIFVSCMHLYREQLFDLSANPRDNNQLRLRETPMEQLTVTGLQQFHVESLDSLYNFLDTIVLHQKIISTFYGSMRFLTGCIFTITINDGTDHVGKLQFFDLPTSERILCGNSEKYSSEIASLHRVVQALTEKLKFVPYRDSHLTRFHSKCSGRIYRGGI